MGRSVQARPRAWPPPPPVPTCSVGLSPRQLARPLQLVGVHLHPNQKGRREDPGSWGEVCYGEEAEKGRSHGLPGSAREARTSREDAGEAPTPAAPAPHSSQAPVCRWKEASFPLGEGGKAVTTEPALVLPVEAIVFPFHVLQAAKAAALEPGLGSNPDPRVCSLCMRPPFSSFLISGVSELPGAKFISALQSRVPVTIMVTPPMALAHCSDHASCAIYLIAQGPWEAESSDQPPDRWEDT